MTLQSAVRDRIRHVALCCCGSLLLALLVQRIGTRVVIDAFALLSWHLVLIVCLSAVLMTISDTLRWRFTFRSRQIPFWRPVERAACG
jgi:hypothetical protein